MIDFVDPDYDKKTLPNSPYKDAVGGVIQAWRPAHWSIASWMFEIGKDTGSSFKFSKGGFQGARGVYRSVTVIIELEG